MLLHFLVFMMMLVLSVLKRVNIRNQRISKFKNLPTDPLESPVSSAISEMLGVAGGIYLALLMLVSFLQIDIPSMVNIYGMEIEPLALISIIITLIQPYVVELKHYWGG